jgi:Glycosyl hydrolases family 18
MSTRWQTSLRLAWFFLSIVFITDSAILDDEDASPAFRVAGYLPDYRIHGINLNATMEKLDDLYLFSLSPNSKLGSKMFSVCCLHSDHYAKARQGVAHAAAMGKRVALWVTVGGGGRSDSFLEAPDTMIQALLELAKKETLQGVDFDCEHFRHQQDFRDYQSLIREASSVLRANGIQVSVALHAGQALSKSIYASVDRINVMTYDMSGGSYHADLQVARQAIRALVKSGCPPRKIFLGMPAYGRHKRQMGEVKTFAELFDSAVARGRSVDDISKLAEIDEFQIDSTVAMAAKVQYAQSKGLGGVFLWELGQDKQHETAPTGILLTATVSSVQIHGDEFIDEL